MYIWIFLIIFVIMDIDEWMDFIYDVNNDPNGYKLINKDNVYHLYILYNSLDGRRVFFKWFVDDEVRNKIIHNYGK